MRLIKLKEEVSMIKNSIPDLEKEEEVLENEIKEKNDEDTKYY